MVKCLGNYSLERKAVINVDTSNYPVKLTVEYKDSYSRGVLIVRTFFAPFYVIIPHAFCLFFYAIAVAAVNFVAWWAILFTGKYPRGMFEFNLGILRWMTRLNAYLNMLTDEYPPFSGK